MVLNILEFRMLTGFISDCFRSTLRAQSLKDFRLKNLLLYSTAVFKTSAFITELNAFYIYLHSITKINDMFLTFDNTWGPIRLYGIYVL